MQHFLRVGQVFRCAKFVDLAYVVASRTNDDQPHQVDRNRMAFGHGKHTTSHWTERGQDGWERKRETRIDLSVEPAIGRKEFEVLETKLCGGGTGHGAHDIFPDGHQVIAREVGGRRLVRFMQSGCFVGMRPPEDIELIRGPADAEPPDTWEEPPSAWVTG